MNYPYWEISTGGGIWVAIIAIAHVFIAHLAVGGGLFLVLTEIKAYRTNNQPLMDYVKSHTRFFLLLTMVFGGISGVGIWFIISLVNPAATSSLIHNFVFGWATEWVFFIAEITALLIYHYRFGKMETKAHIRIGWLYFIFAWLSLFIINGIIGFMLTPGNWLASGSFWDGFFNPTFLPSLIFRTGIAFTLAGIFGLITAAFNKNRELQLTLYRYCAKWLYLPVILIIISGIYYIYTIPGEAYENIVRYNPGSLRFMRLLFWTSILVVVLGLLFVGKAYKGMQKLGIVLILIVALGWMAGFEYLREMARKPYIIYDYAYSNSVLKEDVPMINKTGFLKTAKWSQIKEVNSENLLMAGEEIFHLQCGSCHTFSGDNQIISRTSHLTERGMVAKLTGLGTVHNYMPPFIGTEEEKSALAAFLIRELHKQEEPAPEIAEIRPFDNEFPPFDLQKDEHVLLVWNDLGMHCISDNDKYFSFLPPANTLFAQLVKRGEKPEIITRGVRIEYKVEEGYENPENHVDFWDYAEIVYGAKLEPGMGLAGKGLEGEMEAVVNNSFAAHLIPVTPYRDDNVFNPYPLFKITAKEKVSGKVLAETMAVAPTSTEMGCRNCHQGGWRWNDVAGMDDKTAMNILELHDRDNKTTLLEDALNGNPRLCQSCHQDPALGAPGLPDVLNFSTAIHGFHANYLRNLGHDACNLCHPGRETGVTTCLRGRHRTMGMNCTDCHGTMEDHALSLLKHEEMFRKEGVKKLKANLSPRMIESYAMIIPRMPWLNEPDCISCHENYDIKRLEERPNAYNKWVDGGSVLYRNRTDQHGVMCAACHGSPHAIYFTNNKYGLDRDNIQPVMYQGLAGTIGTNKNCKLCHTIDMKYNGHHRNMIKERPMFREPVNVQQIVEIRGEEYTLNTKYLATLTSDEREKN